MPIGAQHGGSESAFRAVCTATVYNFRANVSAPDRRLAACPRPQSMLGMFGSSKFARFPHISSHSAVGGAFQAGGTTARLSFNDSALHRRMPTSCIVR